MMKKGLRVSAALLAGTLGVLAISMASPSYAATTAVHCESGASLQAAIDAASPGATLSVKGTCVGNFVIGKKLKLAANTSQGVVTLDGSHTGSVVTVASGAVVTITGFTITNGLGSYVPDITTAGGVTNLGTLTLSRVVVAGNSAMSNNGVGGIATYFPGVLTVSNSVINDNTATAAGLPGGILGAGPVTLNSSTVSGNTGTTYGGIYQGGPLTLSKSKVIGNTATVGSPGGIALAGEDAAGGTDLILSSATVNDNSPCNFSCPNH